MNVTMLLPLAIVIPLAFAFALQVVSFLRTKQMYVFINVGAICSTIVTLLTAYYAWITPISAKIGGWNEVIGIQLFADQLSAVFLALSGISMLILIVLSQKELWGFHWRYYILCFLISAAANGIILTADLFNLFIFIEIMSVNAYILTAKSRRAMSLEAGFKYLVQGTIGGQLMLIGIVLLFITTQTLNYDLLSEAVQTLPPEVLALASALILTGLLIKIGVFPVHFWRPDAYTASHTTICALLSGIMVKCYIYVLIRLGSLIFANTVPPFFSMITLVGCLSVICGHLMAMQQDDIKRLLAYSTIAQLGYILIGIGSNSALGYFAAVYHALSHAAMKMGLFFISGVMYEKTQTTLISQMAGLGKNVPRVGAIFAALSLAIVGIPPFNGFVSKYLLIIASLESGYTIPAIVIGIGTVISALYYLNILNKLFSRGDAGFHYARASRMGIIFAALMAIVCLISGVIPLLQTS